MRPSIASLPLNGRLARTALMAICLLAGSFAPSAVSAAGDPPYTASAAEADLTRLLNLERTRAGLATLVIDPWLAKVSRDGDIACPGTSSPVMHGRAKDMASYWSPDTIGYPNDPHMLRLCPSNSALDVMYSTWGYGGASGEIFAADGGYNMHDFPYPFACAAPDCYDHGAAMSNKAATMLMHSAGHRAIILDARYTRFGCGSAPVTAGASDFPGWYYFVCIFTTSDGTSVPSASSTPDPSTSPAPSASPDPLASPAPSASPDPSPSPSVSPPPADKVAPTVRWRSSTHRGRHVYVRATMSDNVGVKSIRLVIDGRTVARWNLGALKITTKSFTRWLPAGRHTIIWYVQDRSGNSQASRTVIRLH